MKNIYVRHLVFLGLSSHREKSCPYLLSFFCLEVAQVADILKWDKFILMGHSKGSGMYIFFGWKI